MTRRFLALFTGFIFACSVGSVAAAPNGFIVAKGWPVGGGKAYNLYFSGDAGVRFHKANDRPIKEARFCVDGLEPGKPYHLLLTSMAQTSVGLIESRPSSPWILTATAGQSPCDIDAASNTSNSKLEQSFGKDLFFGYECLQPGTRWGAHWLAYSDNGHCGTKILFPPDLEDPHVAGGFEGYQAVRLAGHRGGCDAAESYAGLTVNLQENGRPVNLAERGMPTHGIRLMFRLGKVKRRPAASGPQWYAIIVRKKSITPDIMKDSGHDYGFVFRDDRLPRNEWTEIRVPFPEEGSVRVQPSRFLAQPNWIPYSARKPWTPDDLVSIIVTPGKIDADFDFYIGGVAFF